MWKVDEIKRVRIRLASPEEIKSWSRGEVKKADTINYRTERPERGGLFCEQIFGPTKSYECYCGKYRKMKHRGIVCERCGVEVTSARVRRERMGHIELAVPVVHTWYTKKYLPYLLGLKKSELDSVIYFERYLVLEPGNTPLKKLQLLSDEEYREYKKRYGEDSFRAEMGAEAILKVLEKLELKKLIDELREECLKEPTQAGRKKIIRRLEVAQGLLGSGNRPEWMVLKVLPAIPPDFRPMVRLESGIFANSDLNDLYRRIINRNRRLKYLLEIGAPQIIINNERKMFQEAVDALFENEKIRQPILGAGGRPLKSLGETIRGKQGRFRQNLLGKRTDYSGRAVIVVGPALKFYQCGLPEKMALELFKPFLIGELLRKGKAETIKGASDLIEQGEPCVWEILEEVVKNHPVLLNRAPTLHRLSIQAFEPVLVEGEAVQIHPLVCTAFNADFDGDQMAVHIPLSYEAQLECHTLMLSSNNLISPANGSPIATPTQDMAAGCYYLTLEKEKKREKIPVFTDEEEAVLAYEVGKIELHEKIKVRVKGKRLIETTVGRVIFNQILPQEVEFENRPIDKSALSEIIKKIWKKYGNSITAKVLDRIKELGFSFSTLSGLTFSVFDIPEIPEKRELLREVEEITQELNRQREEGEIEEEQRYLDVIEHWITASTQIERKVEQYLSQNPFNPLYLMWKSGARGSLDQLRQIVGMRGLISRSVRETYRRELWEEVFRRHLKIPSELIKEYFYPLSGGRLKGRIREEPVRSNFKEGLTSPEYFVSTSGGRKGLVDTALKTADAGYLTRKLIAVAQDIIITEEDCGTIDGIELRPLKEEEVVQPLSQRIWGRITAEPVKHPRTGETILSSNEEITPELAEKIEKAGVERVKVRSPLTCQARWGICQRCYGWDLSTHELVNLGEAVGIVAAQSIGEPGTQLTLRTFHTGGVAQRGGDIAQGLPRATEIFEARPPKGETIISEISGICEVEEKEDYLLVKIRGDEGEEKEYRVRGEILIKSGERVEVGDKITEGSINPHLLLELKGDRACQEYLVNEAQEVYRAQGVEIKDIHFEVIIRQLMRKVKIQDPGDTEYLEGQEVDKTEFSEKNEAIKAKGGKPATATPVLLGVSRAAGEKESFLSAAAFQRTKQVLTEAAIMGKVDELKSLKENVIMGKLIPAGTGFLREEVRKEEVLRVAN